jgi:hypothetical protein
VAFRRFLFHFQTDGLTMPDANMARPRRSAAPREPEQSRLSQLISGLVLLAVMLLLFVLSGFRG